MSQFNYNYYIFNLKADGCFETTRQKTDCFGILKEIRWWDMSLLMLVVEDEV